MSLDEAGFIVGGTANVTCSSDDGVADRIEIVSEDGQLMISEVSVQTLTLTVNPVTDSLHNTNFTCSVTRSMGTANQTVSNQAITITVNGMTHCYSELPQGWWHTPTTHHPRKSISGC